MTDKKPVVEWRKAGFELAGIVFAVLLALWLESWREDIELQERASEHLERIRAEINQNRTGLKSAIEEHEAYMDGLSAALVSGDISIEAVGPYLQIEGSATSDSAWRSAQMSQSIGKMPLATLGDLASLYDTQAYYTGYLNFFFQGYIDLVSDVQEGVQAEIAVKKFRHHLSIVNSLARQLLRRYDGFLNVEGQLPDNDEAAAP